MTTVNKQSKKSVKSAKATKKESKKTTKKATKSRVARKPSGVPVVGKATLGEVVQFVAQKDEMFGYCKDRRGAGGGWNRIGRVLGILKHGKVQTNKRNSLVTKALLEDLKGSLGWVKQILANPPESDRASQLDQRDVANRMLQAEKKFESKDAVQVHAVGYVYGTPGNLPKVVQDIVLPEDAYCPGAQEKLNELAKA